MSILSRPPSVFWFLFHVEKELAPQGETVFWFLFHVEKELAPQGETQLNGALHKRQSETCPLIRLA